MNRDILHCNTQFILFGAGGDLSRRLIVPALFNLHLDDQLPRKFTLWGVGQKPWQTTDLIEHLRIGVTEHSRRGAPTAADWTDFSAKIRYLQADLNEDAGFAHVKEVLDAEMREDNAPRERIFYLAVPPSLFQQVARGLGRAGLNEDHHAARIVVEKPLGRDLDSFRNINSTLTEVFSEPQIFRIDHFLGKETVQNILAMRFANPIFEPIWNRRYIDHVAVTVAETLGVEHRAGYYDHAGALRDMVQNHLMQILCLIAMEPPVAYDAARPAPDPAGQRA